MLAVKLPRLDIESCVSLGGLIAMVPCLHQGNVHIKRNLQVWRAQKCIPLVGAKTPLTCAGWQTTPSHGGRYRAENGNLRKLGLTYCHGIVYPPNKYIYTKQATDMERTEMYSLSWWRNPTYLCRPANHPDSWGAV